MILPIYRFEVHFTEGVLKGMSLLQDMSFAGEAEAIAWASRVNENNRIGHCDYWVCDLEPNGFKEINLERV